MTYTRNIQRTLKELFLASLLIGIAVGLIMTIGRNAHTKIRVEDFPDSIAPSNLDARLMKMEKLIESRTAERFTQSDAVEEFSQIRSRIQNIQNNQKVLQSNQEDLVDKVSKGILPTARAEIDKIHKDINQIVNIADQLKEIESKLDRCLEIFEVDPPSNTSLGSP